MSVVTFAGHSDQYPHGGSSEAGDCSHPPPKMATAETPTSFKVAFDHVAGHGSL